MVGWVIWRFGGSTSLLGALKNILYSLLPSGDVCPYWNQADQEPLGQKQSVLGNLLGCCLCILTCKQGDFSRREVSSHQTLTQIILGV